LLLKERKHAEKEAKENHSSIPSRQK
jgi:hypothetical protein